MCTSATWNASKRSSSRAFVSRISLQNLQKAVIQTQFLSRDSGPCLLDEMFFQSHVEFYRMSKIAGLELPTRMPWKRIKHLSLSEPCASVLLPYIFSSHVGFEYLQLPLGMHQKNRQIWFLCLELVCKTYKKQWSKHNFYQATAVRFSWMKCFSKVMWGFILNE